MNDHNYEIQEYLNEKYSGREIVEDVDKYVLEYPAGAGLRTERENEYMVELRYIPFPDDDPDGEWMLITGITFCAGAVLSDIRIFTKISNSDIIGTGQPYDGYPWSEQDTAFAETCLSGLAMEQ